MRINFRIILTIITVISVIVLLFTVMQLQQEKERLTIDLERRASLLGESSKDRSQFLTIKPLCRIKHFLSCGYLYGLFKEGW